jgi:Zn-dependent protease with chaperone function
VERKAPAVYYDGLTSKPWEAFVGVHGSNTLEVDVVGADGRAETFHWPLEHKGMQWERSGNTMLRIHFGEHPRKVLIVRDELFIQSFALRMRYSGRQGVYDRVLGAARSGPALFFLAVIALLVGGYVWVLPWASERLALLMPRSLDVQLGDAMFEGMSASLNEDTERSAILQRFGDQLNVAPHFKPTFHYVNDDQVNAFAMPGGHIVVFSGIAEKMTTPGQLAALLAHEGTHVEERHSTRMIMRSMGSYVFLSLLLGDLSGVAGVIAQNADNIRGLGYSRSLESEADGVGQERMKASGVDPAGMVNLLELLDKEAQDMPEELSFLSSHPLTTERMDKARAKAAELGPVAQVDSTQAELFTQLLKP